jgi:hypothetical protein
MTNPSSNTMAQESTQSLAVMSTRNITGAEGLPKIKADSYTAICERIV